MTLRNPGLSPVIVNTGLPTGNDRFIYKIEQALSIKLGYGKRGRQRKSPE
jgi:hypothetical protein